MELKKESQLKETEQLAADAEKLLKSAIDLRLRMTYEERVEAHENARQLLADLKQVGEARRAKS
jgi:hypothetical protein